MRLKVKYWAPPNMKVRVIWPPTKRTLPFSKEYLTIILFTPSIIDIIYDNLQYIVQKCFIKDKTLNCLLRAKLRVTNITLYYTFIQWLIINIKTSLLNKNVLIIRLGVISSLIFYRNIFTQISVKLKLFNIRKGCTCITFSSLVMWKNHKCWKIQFWYLILITGGIWCMWFYCL